MSNLDSTFTRDANGYVTTAISTTYNAGRVNYRGEVYNINYRLPLSNLFPDHDFGTLEFGLEATHNTRYETSVTGFDESRIDGTVEMPDWRGRFDLRFSRGPLKLYYSVDYMPEALTAWEKRPYDVVLMDIEMPVLDGFETTRELRRREHAQSRGRTPIIALSADAMLENRDRAREVGMDEFITKPIEIERLRRMIWSVVRRNASHIDAPTAARGGIDPPRAGA